MNNQLLAALGAVLVAALPLVRAWVQAKLTPARLANVQNMAHVAVTAAELGNNTTGAQKLDFAAGVVASGAKRLGVKLSQDEVLAFVHSALLEMRQADAITRSVHALP